MNVLSYQDYQEVGGGSPIALLGIALGVLYGAGAVRDFADGVFDGFGRL